MPINVPMGSQDGVLLDTAGKYAEDNMQVTPVLQEVSVKSAPYDVVVTPGAGYAGIKKVTVKAIRQNDPNFSILFPPKQTKTVEPTKAQKVVEADEGYQLESVTVEPIPEQYPDVSEDTVTPETLVVGYTAHNAAGEAIEGSIVNNGLLEQTLDVDNQYIDLSGYFEEYSYVEIWPEEKTVTPTSQQQIITPSAGRVLSKVTVEAAAVTSITITAYNYSGTSLWSCLSTDGSNYDSSITIEPGQVYYVSARTGTPRFEITLNY